MPHQVQLLLAGNIKRARARKRLSQMALAGRCGISASYLAEIETCRKFPSADVLQSLADGLKCHPGTLFAPPPEELREPTALPNALSSEIEQSKRRIVEEIESLVSQVYGATHHT